MARGRPDRHEAAQAKDVEREIPCLSFDFAYTAYSENPAEQKLCCLVVHDSTTHAVRAIPIKQKHESLHYMAAEVTRFAVFLGHHEISLRCDAEPVLLKLQGMIQRIRLKQGHPTRIANPAVRDHAGNAHAENTAQRVRGVANSLLFHAQTKCGLRHMMQSRHGHGCMQGGF